jgi:outer membrane lipoprotein-sorting protein
MTTFTRTITIMALTIAAGLVAAVQPAYGQAAPTGKEIVSRVDDVMGAPADQDVESTIVLIDKGGNRKERTIQMLQKGANTRLARFLAPADQKGISVLSLPDGSIYLYLPAFKKVKRIASHVKNTSFADTDFTYDDMEAKRYSERYAAELARTEPDAYVVSLVPGASESGAYSKLLMWVRKDTFVPVTIEYYDAKGALARRMTSDRIEKIGQYWVAREREMLNVATGHRTRMIITNVKFDSGIADEVFTTRYLER